MNKLNNHFKIAVGQLGGRMYYGVPQILYQHNLLSRLYTDWISNKFPVSMINFYKPLRSRLKTRQTPIPPSFVKQMVFPSLKHLIKLKNIKDNYTLHQEYYRFGVELENLIIKDQFNNSQALFMIGSASAVAFKKAKEKGLITIKEQIIAPAAYTLSVMEDAWNDYPDWENPKIEKEILQFWANVQSEENLYVDFIVCGSDFVKEVILKNNELSNRVFTIPYGVPPPPKNSIRISKSYTNRKIRIITVGALSLRKGIPYLIDAAKQLSDICEFKIVGTIPTPLPQLLQHLPENVTLTGFVPRSLLDQYYYWADFFLLPTLSEGSATVCYEALSYGLPIIVTPNAGQFITNKKEGIYIKPKSVNSIVEVLNFINDNRDLIPEMSENALKISSFATYESYESRIINFLNEQVIPE
jgi:glycosyltransferase involved in cell wall biosynthesis